MSLIDPIVYYPKVSVGDTVFAIEWVQSIFRMEDKGICLYTNAPPDDEVHIGLFKKSLKLEKGPLHIFMPGGLKTENVTRLNPSYADIGSNVKLDGYYDRIRDRIVLTGDIDILERGKVYDRKQEPPVINKPELVFGKEGTLLPPSRRSFEFKRTSKGPEITFYDAHDKNIGFMNIHTSQRHRIRVWMQWMDDYRDRIVNAPNTRIVICEAMKKLIQHHPEMNRTSESEMRKLEACSRG